MDADGWDERYRGDDPVWPSEPNVFVVQEVALIPDVGRALDVAAGEGRHAVWLAKRRWDVVAVDWSRAGLDVGRRSAQALGVSVAWELRDVVAEELPGGQYDLVVVAYLQLAAQQRREVLRKCAAVLSPGGHLIIVAHDSQNLIDGVGGPQDADVLYSVDDVLDDLTGSSTGLLIQTAVQAPRQVQGADRPAWDCVIHAVASMSP